MKVLVPLLALVGCLGLVACSADEERFRDPTRAITELAVEDRAHRAWAAHRRHWFGEALPWLDGLEVAAPVHRWESLAIRPTWRSEAELARDVVAAGSGDAVALKRARAAPWALREGLPPTVRGWAEALRAGRRLPRARVVALEAWFVGTGALLVAAALAATGLVLRPPAPGRLGRQVKVPWWAVVLGTAVWVASVDGGIGQELQLALRLAAAGVLLATWNGPSTIRGRDAVLLGLVYLGVRGVGRWWLAHWQARPVPGVYWAAAQDLPSAAPWLLRAGLVGPVFEELVTLGSFVLLSKRIRPLTAALVACGAFGLGHLATREPAEMLAIAAWQLPVVWIFHRTGSLTVPIALHLVANLSVLAWIYAVVAAAGL